MDLRISRDRVARKPFKPWAKLVSAKAAKLTGARARSEPGDYAASCLFAVPGQLRMSARGQRLPSAFALDGLVTSPLIWR